MEKTARIKLRSGNDMPVIGLGTWQLQNDTKAVLSALELGYRLIDTSSDYGSHAGIGEALQQTAIVRDRVYITTKVEEDDDAYERAQKNLEELDLEYVDLLLIHRPPPDGAGEALWNGLLRAKEEGLTRDIGVSNYSTELIDTLIQKTGEAPTVNQIEWSPFGHSDDMLAYCREKNIIIQAYSPLTRTKRLDDQTLAAIGEKYGKSPAQIMLRWNLQLGVVPLPKAGNIDHQAENIAIFDFEISDEDMSTLSGLNERYSSLGSLPYG